MQYNMYAVTVAVNGGKVRVRVRVSTRGWVVGKFAAVWYANVWII